jgi:hypothetical protein
VQHLDPNHESILTEILQNPLQFFLEIADDIKVEHNHVIPAIKYWGGLQMAFSTTSSKPDIFFYSIKAISTIIGIQVQELMGH